MWPSVMLIGAPKAGTTAFSELLIKYWGCPANIRTASHFTPNIPKEPCFFSIVNDTIWNDMRASDYELLFQNCKRNKYFDASTQYLPFAKAPERSYKIIPEPYRTEMKILVILREPISRDLSRYNNQVENVIRGKQRNLGGCFLSLVHAMQPWVPTYNDVSTCEMNIWNKCRNISSCTSKLVIGMYSFHLKKWLRFWRYTQIKVVNYEYLQDSLKDIFNFIQLQHTDKQLIKLETANQNPYSNKVKLPECKIVNRLHAIYRPHNELLYKMFTYFKIFSNISCDTKIQIRMSAKFRHVANTSLITEFL